MPETLGIWIAAILTLAIYSFLYKDNPFYKFAEHIFVGVSVGYSIVILYDRVFKPRVIDQLFIQGRLELIIPLLLGMCYLTSFSRKYSWIARYPIAYFMGLGAGVALPLTMATNVLLQLRGTFAQDVGGEPTSLLSFAKFKILFNDPTVLNFMEAFYGPVLVIGVMCVMLFFFFSVEQKRGMKVVSNLGILFLMVGFGASFGYTVMARISLLIGRIEFLLGDWLHLL